MKKPKVVKSNEINSNKSDLLRIINLLSETKGLDKQIIIKFLLNSIQKVIHSQLDPEADINLTLENEELKLINNNKLVIPDDEEYKGESNVIDIHLKEALEIDPNAKVGDFIASPISFNDFSRSTFSKIEQSFRMEILNWEKKRVFDTYFPLIGQEVEAKLEEDSESGALFKLADGTLCYMPPKYCNKNINLSDSRYHKVVIEEVYENNKATSYQVLVSNNTPNKIRELLKQEVPEIEKGLIQIMGISRIKGERCKISFRKNPNLDMELDVLGSIIGPNGSRINRVSQLFGEKIDLILYSDNLMEYISNALSPAKVISIMKKQNEKSFLVIVPDQHNTLAIGKKGQNVKLTVELIRSNLDICSLSDAKARKMDFLWNGNITPEEVQNLAKSSNNTLNNQNQNLNNSRRYNAFNKNNHRHNDFNDIMSDFDKEIEEYNLEVSTYEPLDFSQFDLTTLNKNKKNNQNEAKAGEINSNLNSVNENNLAQNNNENSISFDDESPTEIINAINEDVLTFNEKNNQKTNEPKKRIDKVNEKIINKVNENFKYDKDIAGGINLDELDFSDFDDDDN